MYGTEHAARDHRFPIELPPSLDRMSRKSRWIRRSERCHRKAEASDAASWNPSPGSAFPIVRSDASIERSAFQIAWSNHSIRKSALQIFRSGVQMWRSIPQIERLVVQIARLVVQIERSGVQIERSVVQIARSVVQIKASCAVMAPSMSSIASISINNPNPASSIPNHTLYCP